MGGVCSQPAVSQADGWFSWQLRVGFAETDAQRIVHHAEYLVYMEEARCELVRALGVPYKLLEERGVNLVVTRADLRYKAPAVYDDLLRVRTRVGCVRSREVVFEYRIEHAGSGRLLVEGVTQHVFVDRDLKAIRAPEWAVSALVHINSD